MEDRWIFIGSSFGILVDWFYNVILFVRGFTFWTQYLHGRENKTNDWIEKAPRCHLGWKTCEFARSFVITIKIRRIEIIRVFAQRFQRQWNNLPWITFAKRRGEKKQLHNSPANAISNQDHRFGLLAIQFYSTKFPIDPHRLRHDPRIFYYCSPNGRKSGRRNVSATTVSTTFDRVFGNLGSNGFQTTHKTTPVLGIERGNNSHRLVKNHTRCDD